MINQNQSEYPDYLPTSQKSFKNYFYETVKNADKYYQTFVDQQLNDLDILMDFQASDLEMLVNDCHMNRMHARNLLKNIKVLKKSNIDFQQWLANIGMKKYYEKFKNGGIVTLQIMKTELICCTDLVEFLLGDSHEKNEIEENGIFIWRNIPKNASQWNSNLEQTMGWKCSACTVVNTDMNCKKCFVCSTYRNSNDANVIEIEKIREQMQLEMKAEKERMYSEVEREKKLKQKWRKKMEIQDQEFSDYKQQMEELLQGKDAVIQQNKEQESKEEEMQGNFNRKHMFDESKTLPMMEQNFKTYFYETVKNADKYYQRFVDQNLNDLDILMDFQDSDLESLVNDCHMNRFHARHLLKNIKVMKKMNTRFQQWLTNIEMHEKYYQQFVKAGIITLVMLEKFSAVTDLVDFLGETQGIADDGMCMWDNLPKNAEMNNSIRRKADETQGNESGAGDEGK